MLTQDYREKSHRDGEKRYVSESGDAGREVKSEPRRVHRVSNQEKEKEVEEQRGLKVGFICLIFTIWVITVGFLYLRLRDTQTKLTELERGITERISDVEDGIGTDIENLRAEMEAGFEEQGNQISEARMIQSNTNKALARLSKETRNTAEQFREELKKD